MLPSGAINDDNDDNNTGQPFQHYWQQSAKEF